jgi:hypothetical protein
MERWAPIMWRSSGISIGLILSAKDIFVVVVEGGVVKRGEWCEKEGRGRCQLGQEEWNGLRKKWRIGVCV